jgi:transcriptional regulator with XRE-family HTH domain
VRTPQRHVPPAELGPALRQARLLTGLTQQLLADLVGVTQAHVSYLETGQRCPSTAVARVLVDMLDLDEITLRRLDAAAVPNVGRCLGVGLREREKAWRFIHLRP